MTIRYVPSFTTSSGLEEVVSGSTTAPTYGARAFCWAIACDPNITLPTTGAMLEYGGRAGNTSRSSSLRVVVRDPRWMYTSTTTASPTNIDMRFAAPLELFFRWVSTSTTNTQNYGHLILNFTAEFMGPIATQTTIGVAGDGLETKENSTSTEEDEVEIKSEDSPVLVSDQRPTPKLKISLNSPINKNNKTK